MNNTSNFSYRYPGSSPFNDSDYDRLLFFGREIEIISLLHKILAHQVVVLFAKSGMGKTSLINAGLMHHLREKKYVPLRIRFNNPDMEPIQCIYSEINEIVKQQKLEFEEGEKETLWQYFKTVEFWSSNDTLMTPVLILDQFEEFFNLHSVSNRNMFIKQFSHLVCGYIPKELRQLCQLDEQSPYSEKLPNVKIVISIREDFLGLLEEMSYEIPDILQNRFRLLPLNRAQAKLAIEQPAKLDNVTIQSQLFRYDDKTINIMLDFLSKHKIKSKNVISDKIEPFQLQLLCRDIESKVYTRKKKHTNELIVKEDILGGEAEMQNVLKNFYDNVVKKLGSYKQKIKKNVRKLCENGLISISDKRLSIEEEEIERKYKISKEVLHQLVNNRLLRTEQRLGSYYYELSHDTLIKPIRESQRKRHIKRNILFIIVLIVILFPFTYSWKRAINELNLRKNAQSDIEFGQFYSVFGKLNLAIDRYNDAINKGYEDATLFLYLGNVYYRIGMEKRIENRMAFINQAIDYYKKVIEVDRTVVLAYYLLGDIYQQLGKNEEAINYYTKAIDIKPDTMYGYNFLAQTQYFKNFKNADESSVNIEYFSASEIHNNRGSTFFYNKEYEKAIQEYNKAIELYPNFIKAYINLGDTFQKLNKYKKAIKFYKMAIQKDPLCSLAYKKISDIFYEQGQNEEAEKYYNKYLDLKSK